MEEKEIINLLEKCLKELVEIKQLIKHQTYLFEKYDTQVFEEEELLREIQNKFGTK